MSPEDKTILEMRRIQAERMPWRRRFESLRLRSEMGNGKLMVYFHQKASGIEIGRGGYAIQSPGSFV